MREGNIRHLQLETIFLHRCDGKTRMLDSVSASFDQSERAMSLKCPPNIYVQPLRAKHCKIINRCIKRFDHHCAYVGNSIGYHNQHHFYLFVASTVVMLWTFHYIAYQTQHQEAKQDWWLLFCQIICGVFTFLVTPLFVSSKK
jgi:hypothetical protein